MDKKVKDPRPVKIRVRRVDKKFSNDVLALDNFSLTVRQGEFVSLLGPSGCGKSTALKMMAGLLSPSAGRIQLADADAEQGSVGFVFQDSTLMPWATVFDNVYLPFRLKSISKGEARDRVEDALSQVDLLGFAKAYPKQLSGGMKMRVSIARALVTKPSLLLMDEPFAALDEMSRFKLNNDVLRLWHSEALTVLFVTHSVFESVYLSTRVEVMAARPGRIIDTLYMPDNHPRTEDYRTTGEYVENCRVVSESLHRATRNDRVA